GVTLPSIQVTNTTVCGLDSVVLICSSNDTGICIHWLFNGQSLGLTDRMMLIETVRRQDSGDYQCEVSNPVSSKRSDPIQLDIISPLPSLLKSLLKQFRLTLLKGRTFFYLSTIYQRQSKSFT
ncbi:hypothetical protein A6R68_05868, partial [Neotoma lepida]